MILYRKEDILIYTHLMHILFVCKLILVMNIAEILLIFTINILGGDRV